MSSRPDRERVRRGRLSSHLLAWAGLLLTCSLLFLQSYERWGHPIIDLGRDLYLPGQILAGRTLYREILYNYGPVAPYSLAGVVALLGDELRIFAAFGLATALAAMLALYVIGCQLQGVVTGFACAFCFAVVSVFGNSTWGCNFVLPYAYAATLGLSLALGSFASLLRHCYGGRHPLWLAASVSLALLALWTKVETGVMALGVLAVAWWAHRLSLRGLGLALAATTLLAVATAGAFAARSPAEHSLLSENLGKFGSGLSDRFFLAVAGLDDPLRNATWMLAAGVGVALLVAVSAPAARFRQAVRDGRPRPLARAALAVVTATVLLAILSDVRVFAAAPLAALVLAWGVARRDRRDPLLLLACLVLFSAPRVLLQYHPLWYGFTLGVPAIPLAVYGLGVRLPPHTERPRATRAVLLLLACLTLARFELANWSAHRAMTAVLRTPKGTLHDQPLGRVEAIDAFLRHLEASAEPAPRSMVVLPEGATLNYFSGFPNPTAYLLFTPPEIRSLEVERRMLSELEALPPDYVVVTSRDLSEFGSRGFGVDYAQQLDRWVRHRYVRERVFGDSTHGAWKLELWRRGDEASDGGRPRSLGYAE